MKLRTCLAISLCLSSLIALALSASVAQAAAEPTPDIKATWGDTNLPPGGEGVFTLQVKNIGSSDFEPGLKIIDELPAGVTATKINWGPETAWEVCGTLGWAFCEGTFGISPNCSGIGTETVTCELTSFDILLGQGRAPQLNSNEAQTSGYLSLLFIEVAVAPSASGVGTNRAVAEGGGASLHATDADSVPFSTTPSQFGIVPGSFEGDVFDSEYPSTERSRKAGDHPYEFRAGFDFNTASVKRQDDGTREAFANGLVRNVEVTLPRGLIGNPEALPKCDPIDFAQAGISVNSSGCPADTQVGYLNIRAEERGSQNGRGGLANANSTLSRVALYNLVPPKGTPVDLGFNAATYVQGHIFAELDPAQNYAIKSISPNISASLNVLGTNATIWGVPGDPAHDKFRYLVGPPNQNPTLGAPFTAPIRPFFTNPMDCGFENGGARLRADSYENPGAFTPVNEDAHALDVTGCDDPRFLFKPKVALQPTDSHAGAPTGLDVHLEVPQKNDEAKEAKELYAQNGSTKGVSTPPIKRAVVTLPAGMTLSPSAAQGLGSCSLAQIGLGDNAPVTCPDSSQFGKLIIHTPILPLDAQPEGFIYVAKQGENPFHNFLSIYLVIEEPDRGILVKIPGRVDLDPDTGQITTTFEDLPQFPVSDLQLSLKGGVRAGLVNPSTCGTKTIRAEFFTWQDSTTPHVVNSSYDVSQKPDGSPCVNRLGERSFKPTLNAGTVNNVGGSYSPFAMRLTRSDDDQEFSQLGVTLPAGLAAKFAGVGVCSDAAIAAAERRTGAGEGALERANPSCPASSLVGTTEVGTGVGVPLSYVPGKVYLAGPYRGAPLSIVVISPVVVGPFDLGVIAVRTALRVDPRTAQGSAQTDPFPQIFQGIPVRIRDIRLDLDRPGFTINPTSCAEKRIDAHITGTGQDVNSILDDSSADLVNRFQAADCASLGFKPKLALRLTGGSQRGAHPRLKATVTYPKRGAYANIARASVTLPRSEFLDQGHIKTVCTRVQFAAQKCPAGSIYGHAVAKTPLFDAPLEGPVYLRSSTHELPDLVAALRGSPAQPVEVDLDGRIDSVGGGIRSTFEVVPDAPVETFTLRMQGGKKGLLVNSTDLCASTNRAAARFTAQNGKALGLHPAVRSTCGKPRTHPAKR